MYYMAVANLNHFVNYKNNVLNQATLEEFIFLDEPPRYLQFKEPLDLYPYSLLNETQRKSFRKFTPTEESLTLTDRSESNLLGFQDPRGKSTSIFMATPSKVVGYLTLQIQSHHQYTADIPQQHCTEVGIQRTDKLAVIKCLAVDQDFEGKDIGSTLFSVAIESLLHQKEIADYPIRYVVWESLESSHSYYQDKLGFEPFKLGRYNFVINLEDLVN